MTLRIDDVEKPDGVHTEHEVVRGSDGAGVVALDGPGRVLMIWRHRFLPGTWGWEIPGGAIDAGETPAEAARRELREESGWTVTGELELLSEHHPSVGLVNQTFWIYLARDVQHAGPPTDANEAAEIAWRTPGEIAEDFEAGRISDGFSQLGVVLALMRTGRADVLRR